MNDSVAPEYRGAPFIVIAAALLCALTAVLVTVLPARAGSAAAGLQPWAGDALLTFSLNDSGGANTSLDSARGHIVLVHFFATWCEPCREELPALNRLAARGDNVKVIAISVAEADLRVRRFIETMPVNFPVLLDRERTTAKAWNVTTLPTTFVLDADLRPRLMVESDFAWDTFDAAKMGDEMKNIAVTNPIPTKPN